MNSTPFSNVTYGKLLGFARTKLLGSPPFHATSPEKKVGFISRVGVTFQILGPDFFSFLCGGWCGLFTFYDFNILVVVWSFVVVVRIKLKAKSLVAVLFVCNRLNS
jgi:hypothetical protein